ncbi:plasmid transfer protein [Lelliottia amnigena]|uniref:plasmid transfer protein n=1 Tax=Lelliottia TaxID=1330545 RepID=UPI00192ABD91|nr:MULTISPECIES: plasmid transfer protein [Lelliottia]MBL5885678.1 plasmid transfer protein [Lelliottia aquatilis]MBL5923256.1 plasmid transfer protein [Lelliottia amnigena]MBL5932166.1 plasmid transfer protein [Lelliottia amnigena]
MGEVILNDVLVHPLKHKTKLFGKKCALAFEINTSAEQGVSRTEYISSYDNYFLSLEVAPSKDPREYDWNSANSIFFKLSQNEVLALTSVFLRIKPVVEFRNRKTTHRTHTAYKNLTIAHNQGEGLYLSAGVIPLKESNFPRIMHSLPINQMDCLNTGMFLLGFLTLKMPWMNSESIITALRLSESKQPSA